MAHTKEIVIKEIVINAGSSTKRIRSIPPKNGDVLTYFNVDDLGSLFDQNTGAVYAFLEGSTKKSPIKTFQIGGKSLDFINAKFCVYVRKHFKEIKGKHIESFFTKLSEIAKSDSFLDGAPSFISGLADQISAANEKDDLWKKQAEINEKRSEFEIDTSLFKVEISRRLADALDKIRILQEEQISMGEKIPISITREQTASKVKKGYSKIKWGNGYNLTLSLIQHKGRASRIEVHEMLLGHRDTFHPKPTYVHACRIINDLLQQAKITEAKAGHYFALYSDVSANVG